MDNKIKYRNFCLENTLSPIFFNDWWLDAVCGKDNWGIVLHLTNDKIVGALPYYRTKKLFFFTAIKMPLLTSYLGPMLIYPDNMKYASRLGFEHEVIESLYMQLPPFSFLRNRFSPSITNWLPLYWQGFKQTTKYTYTIPLNDLDAIYKDLKSNIRGKIKKAEGLVKIEFIDDVGVFHNMHEKTFSRQKINNPIKLPWLKNLDDTLSSRNRRKIAIAIDEKKQIHSAAYIFWDNECGYLSMVGEDPDLRNSGAGILLVWEMVKYAKEELGLKTFDFLGSMLKNVEIVRRSMGAQQTQYFEISKSIIPLNL